MILTVKGYKCLKEEVKMDINKVNVLWGPMGAGKSSILESLAIFIDILNGRLKLEGDKISSSSLKHLQGIRFNDLVNLSEKYMSIGVQDLDYLFTITYNKDSQLFQAKLSSTGREVPIAEINDLTVDKISEITKEIREIVLEGKRFIEDRYGREEKKFIKDVIENAEKQPNIKKYLEGLLKSDFIYISHHRTAPSEIKFGEFRSITSSRLSSMGENLLDLLFNLVVQRVREEKVLTELEGCLRSLEIISKQPSIEVDLQETFEDSSIRIDGKDIRVLSCGERNTILLLLGSIIVENNQALIIEEPEIGIHVINFNKLLSSMLKELEGKNSILILSTHSPIPLHAFRSKIIKREVNPKDINFYYIYKEDGKVEIINLKFGNEGRLILTPDARTTLRSMIDIDLVKNIL
ncbi:MAG: AAA family ATPase [Nitrososphaerota archaeon]